MGWLEFSPLTRFSLAKPVYGDHASDKPDNTIPVLNNDNGDINAGYGGKFVWLVAQYHDERGTGISDIRVVFSDHAREGALDLAKGAGGLYRYLEFRYGGEGERHVKQVVLARRSEPMTAATAQRLGFQDFSDNIDHGRRSFIYLLWNY
ncbi:hypothetical protein BO86DRAFT_381103 [Aspergillus japonicus CBS 114.51]|uniref:Uncharacterized protein n=1 Tax=Aspergillus japonicus CBS 114.51 TaxID=1448312 RepID=A0A8T8WV12_ASPJA|nr:hypothetical protein BO86DRAFT_381103 [Aspergillus japonicus CBS 114.51]RAH79623.1 hypothetical protein BO86DRAFT_381103 [Aspergillus japonicus CBS 114.51]